MAISNTSGRLELLGTGSATAFSVTYPYYNQTELQVYQGGTLKTLGTHYTVSPTTRTVNSAVGGTVTFVTAPANGESVIILRVEPLTQGSDLQDNAVFPADTVEQEFDKRTLTDQQMQEQLNRSLHLGPATLSTVSALLPTLTANKYLQANSAGDGVLWSTPGSGANKSLGALFLSDYTSLANAVSSIGTTPAVLIMDTTSTVTANLTVPTTLLLWYPTSAVTTVNTGVTLTIGQKVDAGLFQVFSLTGSATLVFSHPCRVHPEWWGGKADNSTDNRVPVNNAILSLPQSGAYIGGEVFFSGGTYLFTTNDSTDTEMIVTACWGRKNIKFNGLGASSILATTLNKHIFGCSALTTTTTSEKIEFTGLHFLGDQPGDVDPPAKGSQHAILVNLGTSYDSIYGLHVHNCLFDKLIYAVFFGPGSSDVNIHDNRVLDSHAGFQGTSGGSRPILRTRVNFNTIAYSTSNRTGDDPIAFFYPVDDLQIIGNYIDGNSTSAMTLGNSKRILVENTGTTSDHYTKRVTIAHNTVRRVCLGTFSLAAGGTPINITSTNTTAGSVQDIKVVDNVIEDSIRGLNYASDDMNGVNGLLIQGNTIRNVDGDGIVTSHGVGIQILDNTIENYNRTGSGTAGILVKSTPTDVVIARNRILSPVSAGYGLWCQGVTRLLIEANLIRSVNVDGIFIDTSTRVDVLHNVIDTATAKGIHFNSSATDMRVIGNRIRGLGTANTTSSIEFSDACINVQILNNHLDDGYIGIRVDQSASTAKVLIEGNYVNSMAGKGISLYGSDLVVNGNVVLASADWGIGTSNAVTRGTISNNHVRGGTLTGIEVANSSTDIVLTGNVCTGNGEDGIEIQGATRTTVIGNILTGNTGYGLDLVPAGTAATGVTIAENYFASNTAGVINYTSANTGTKFRGNTGWVTEASGTGSIASGATTAVITHGLSVTPAAKDINVVFTEQGSNDYGRWWLSTFTSTQFTVNVSADPGASNLDFSWNAQVL